MIRFKQFLSEETEDNVNDHLDDFVNFCVDYLNLKEIPKINLIDDEEHAASFSSFGGYKVGADEINVVIAGRHLVDIFRSLAHELVHHAQHEGDTIKDDPYAGQDGSDIENEANAVAGIIMRKYGKANPQLFKKIVAKGDFVQEAIKGWKHAGADITKMRSQKSQEAKSANLVRLKADGQESGMHDAKSFHNSEQEAIAQHDYRKSINPGKKIRHNLYVDGKLVKVLD